jgi:hypothetical protein
MKLGGAAYNGQRPIVYNGLFRTTALFVQRPPKTNFLGPLYNRAVVQFFGAVVQHGPLSHKAVVLQAVVP